jgi:hypothetical protein
MENRITSPIHRLLAHPTLPVIYLATASSLHKYNLQTSSVDATFTSPSGHARYLDLSAEWLFITGGDKLLHVLNAHTLEHVAQL